MTRQDIYAGLELEPLVIDRISRATLALFAGASNDHNPIHIDLDVARDAGLEDVFVHGMLSMAYLARYLTDWVPQGQIRSMSTRFAAITPVGAQPTCQGRVVAVDGRTATVDLDVTLPDGTTTLSGAAVVELDRQKEHE